MNGIRPILKDVEQDTLDIAKVFKLLSEIKIDNKKAIDVYFTEQGVGYLNAMASLNPKLFVVPEEKYLVLEAKFDELKKHNLEIYHKRLELIKENEKLRLNEMKLKQTIDNLRKPKWWEIWK